MKIERQLLEKKAQEKDSQNLTEKQVTREIYEKINEQEVQAAVYRKDIELKSMKSFEEVWNKINNFQKLWQINKREIDGGKKNHSLLENQLQLL